MSCKCVQEFSGARGQQGFHMIPMGDRSCWKQGRLDVKRDGDEEVWSCACTRGIWNLATHEWTMRPEPACFYEGLDLVFERCPSYWAAAGRTIDPTDPDKLLAVAGSKPGQFSNKGLPD